MTSSSLLGEIQRLLCEKDLICGEGVVEYVSEIALALKRKGIRPDQQMLDFVIDVLRAMAYLQVSPDDTFEDILERKDDMMDWLEALGWRREWFTQPIHEQRAA